MLRLEFTTEMIQTLHHERFHHPHPHVQRKMEAVYLISQGLSRQFVCRLTHVSRNTLNTYLRQYQEGGVVRLQELRFHQPQSAFAVHQETLAAYFTAHPPTSVNHARATLTQLTDITRSPTQVRAFLHRCGLRCRKVGGLPAKADPAVQAHFLATQLQPRLDEAVAGQRHVFFMDAAHFVLGAFLGWLWSAVRLFVPTPSGRQRFNVLGALHAVTREILTVTNTTYITATEVCQLLTQLAAQFPDRAITVVLDNARYQRCHLVCQHAAHLGIELLFLPPYSPNLNLIERLWKFVKKECLYSHYYEKFDPFKTAISDCLATAPVQRANELKSLFTLKFQTFENAQIMTV
ncbi:MAG TPA: IS630 family transposase [Blastocatellia bacterium]|nr:IS630 family transposase [Blastocatellia bacterium]